MSQALLQNYGGDRQIQGGSNFEVSFLSLHNLNWEMTALKQSRIIRHCPRLLSSLLMTGFQQGYLKPLGSLCCPEVLAIGRGLDLACLSSYYFDGVLNWDSGNQTTAVLQSNCTAVK